MSTRIPLLGSDSGCSNAAACFFVDSMRGLAPCRACPRPADEAEVIAMFVQEALQCGSEHFAVGCRDSAPLHLPMGTYHHIQS